MASALWQLAQRRTPGESGDSGGPHGRTLKDIFRIVAMVLVEPADGDEFLRAFDVAFREAVLPIGADLLRWPAKFVRGC